jgi:hypothetical protein
MTNHITEQLTMPLEVEQVSTPACTHKVKGSAAFIPYEMNQLCLPLSLEELIPPHHVVRIVNDAVDRIDDEIFLKQYPGGVRPAK